MSNETLMAMMDEADAMHEAGLDILRTRLRNKGIAPLTFHDPEMLTYPLSDGTTFVITGHGRQDYDVARYVDADAELVVISTRQTLDQTLKILTFQAS